MALQILSNIALASLALLVLQCHGSVPGVAAIPADASVKVADAAPANKLMRTEAAPANPTAAAAAPANTAAAANAAANHAAVDAAVAAAAANAAANTAATAAANAKQAATLATATANSAAHANQAAIVATPIATAVADANQVISSNVVTVAAPMDTAATNANQVNNAVANVAANAAVSANIAAIKAATAAANAKEAATLATATANAAANVANTATSAVISPNVVGAASSTTDMQAVPSSSQWAVTRLIQFILGLTVAMIVKLLCIAGNVLVQLSPLPQAKMWEALRCTGESDAAPYVSIAFGGCQWCFYGTFAYIVTGRSGFLVLVQSNFLGAVLGTYYVTTFYRNCHKEDILSTLQKYVSGISSLVLLEVCSLSTLSAERSLFLIGLISSFCSFMGATSVLVTVPSVIKTKDGSSIPATYALANLISAFLWSLCGYIIEDPMVTIPNIFSTLCSVISLALKVIYTKDPKAETGKKLEGDAIEDINFSFSNIQESLMKQPYDEKSQHSEFGSLQNFVTEPSECTAIAPNTVTHSYLDKLSETEAGQIDETACPDVADDIKSTLQKLPAAESALQSAIDCLGDGTGGTF
jgi:uncharacterized protein with PQ loop repeat